MEQIRVIMCVCVCVCVCVQANLCVLSLFPATVFSISGLCSMWPPYNLGIVIGFAEDHDTTLCQQMLTAVKCVTDDNFCFSAGQHTGTSCMQHNVRLQESFVVKYLTDCVR